MGAAKNFRGKVKSVVLDELELKQAGNDYHFEGYANRSDVVDRYNEMVDATAYEGTLETYANNPIMLYQHDPRMPIGHFPKLELRSNGLWVGGVIAKGYEIADTARSMVEQKVLRAMSIGFRETKRGEVDKNGIYHIKGLELLEISLVSIPANQEALFSMDEHGKLLSIDLIPEDESMYAAERIDALARKRGFIQVPGSFEPEHAQKLLDAFGEPTDAEVHKLRDQLLEVLEVQSKGVVSYVKYPTQDAATPWDSGAARKQLRAYATSDGKVNFAKYRAGFTYVVDGLDDKLAGYKLPHHFADGGIQTNLRGCRAVIGVIAGARGGVNIPDAAKAGVYTHVARHIKEDFNADVPAFEDLGKMAEADLLVTLEVTAEELDTVIAEFKADDVVLFDDINDPPPAETPADAPPAKAATTTPPSSTDSDSPSIETETEKDPEAETSDAELDFSQIVEAIDRFGRESKSAADLEDLKTQLEATQAAVVAVDGKLAESVGDLRKDIEARLADLKASIDILLKIEGDRLKGEVGRLSAMFNRNDDMQAAA